MISKNTISRIDPYSISQMEFNIKNVSKYTTIKSLFATIAIFAVTVLINLSNLKQIYLERWELPVTQTKVLYNPSEMPLFTQFPVCFENHNTSDQRVPTVVAYNGLNYTVPLMSHQQVRSKYPQIARKMKSEKYECVNFINTTFLESADTQSLFVTTDFTNITAHLRLVQINDKRYGRQPKVESFLIDRFGLNRAVRLSIRNAKFIYRDQLSINYEPRVEVQPLYQGFRKVNTGVSDFRIPMNCTLVISSIIGLTIAQYDAYYSTVQYTFFRQNIGTILGKLFAWYSILMLIFVTIIGPIVDFSLNVQLVKTLYSHDYLNNMESSLISQIKFYLSSLCKNCIRQRILQVAFEKLDKDTDILNLLKKQIMMKRISKELRYSENQIELYVPDFDYDKNLDKELLQKDEEDSDQQKQVKRKETEFIVEQDQTRFNLFRLMGRLLEMFDFSDIKVGLVYNKGKPTGSIWSILVALLGIGVFVAFLLYTGAAVIEINDTSFIQIISKDMQSIQTEYWFEPQQILFRMERNSGSLNFTFLFGIFDSAGNIVQNITMKTGASCNRVLEAMGFQNESFFYCLPKRIRLFASKNDFNSFGFQTNQANPVGFFSYSAYIKQIRWQKKFVKVAPYSSRLALSDLANNTILQKLRLARLQDDSENYQNNFIYFNEFNDLRTIQNAGKRFLFRIDHKKTVINRKKSTIWEIIDSTWVVILLVFQVFVFKISRIINSRIKKGQSSSDRQRERLNIINIVANHDRLINGAFRNELNAVKYYFKDNLSIADVRQ